MAKSVSAAPVEPPPSAPGAPGTQPTLILASGSRYRAELLRRLHLDFIGEASEIDETPQPGEDVASLVRRLALAKARALRSEEHTSELQSLMRISYAVFCLKKKKHPHNKTQIKMRFT